MCVHAPPNRKPRGPSFAKPDAQVCTFVCIGVPVLADRWFRLLFGNPLTAAIDVIISDPFIFCHGAGGFVKVIIIFADFYPALCHSGIAEEVIAFAFVGQPLLRYRYAGFIEIIFVPGSGSPAVSEHCPVFAVIVIFVARALHPSGEAFAAGSTVIIIPPVFKGTADQPAFGIVEIVIAADFAPSGFFWM